MNGYFISITNNLLEDKHYEAMGQSVWLYMWLIDKMTDISEGQGIVNYGNPITYAQVAEHLTSLSDRTYRRMLATLRDAGYINTMQAKYGVYVTINKAKKQFGRQAQSSPAKNGLAGNNKPASSVKSGRAARPKMSTRPAKFGRALYIDNNTNNNTSLHKTTNVVLAAEPQTFKAEVSKLYYEVIKALDIPVSNHNNVRAKIAELSRSADKEAVINYLKFMRDQFASLDWEYKPHISEALDIYSKRGKIRETLKDASKNKEQTVWKAKAK